jgi:LmbE family N-acetylglucosaminyl deacetylase
MGARSVTIVSPHLDDAVLSCWHLLAGPGTVEVANVFTGSPQPGPPAWWDVFTGATDSVTRMQERLDEDRTALSIAGRRAHNLGFLDEQYEPENRSVEAIAERLAEVIPRDAVVVAPAAITVLGEDHRDVSDAALMLRASGHEVHVYADYPHALRQGWPSWVNGSADGATADILWADRLAELGVDRTSAEVAELDERERGRKLQAVSAYRTQIDGLAAAFGHVAGFPAFPHEVTWRLARP